MMCGNGMFRAVSCRTVLALHRLAGTVDGHQDPQAAPGQGQRAR